MRNDDMDKVKVGFIGCGGIAQFHFGHMEKMDNAQVVAACDLIEERANKTAARFQAKAYTSYKDMFEREQLDAVFVCVEPSAHNGMEMMAIERGINVFVQKPMSLDLAYAKDVRDAIADKGVVSAVGFQCRYVDTLPRAKGWLDGQDIGMAVCPWSGGGGGMSTRAARWSSSPSTTTTSSATCWARSRRSMACPVAAWSRASRTTTPTTPPP